MKKLSLRTIIFLSLCCDLGLFSKRLISPISNLLTDALHIPGGIGTSFSLMFLVIAVMLVPCFGCGIVMGAVQSAIALGLGMVGSMGALSPIGYILPGLTIDLLFWLTRKADLSCGNRMALLNAAAAVCASLCANLIVFRLRGAALLLYICIAITSGTMCGLLGESIVLRVAPVIGSNEFIYKKKMIKEG